MKREGSKNNQGYEWRKRRRMKKRRRRRISRRRGKQNPYNGTRTRRIEGEGRRKEKSGVGRGGGEEIMK